MSVLFEKIKINQLELENRFVRSATWEGMAGNEGEVTENLIKLNAKLAENNIGLIISGHAYVTPQGKAGSGQLGAYSDSLVSGLAELTGAIHAKGGKIFLQLAHAGGFADSSFTGTTPLGPSVITGKNGPICREMTEYDIKNVTNAMKNAAIRAEKAGFDGIQIHSAHGYLLSQFLSPFFNKRKDQYGGDLNGRSRLLMEIADAIRNSVPNNFPVCVKINAQDFTTPEFSVNDMVKTACMLEKKGINAIEISGGITINPPDTSPVRKGALKTRNDEVYYMDAVSKLKDKINIPVMIVGGIRSFEVAENLVQSEFADLISFSRPLICEPDLIKRWKNKDTKKAACISCNKCFIPAMSGKGLYCLVKNKS